MFHTPAHKQTDPAEAPGQARQAPEAPRVRFDFSTIMEYEDGNLSDFDLVDFVQDGIDNGLIWNLQGSYGRLATRMIESGLCHR